MSAPQINRSACSTPSCLQASALQLGPPLIPCTHTRYDAVKQAVKSGTAVPPEHANKVADAIQKWATSKGCLNYSHIFYPMRGMKSGQKKDAFIDLDYGDSKPIRDIVWNFNGSKVRVCLVLMSPAVCPRVSM
jgi:hypothetical protein